jgi:hypothetical protein
MKNPQPSLVAEAFVDLEEIHIRVGEYRYDSSMEVEWFKSIFLGASGRASSGL